jgi:tetratricopeptide (TPR) repeat protein
LLSLKDRWNLLTFLIRELSVFAVAYVRLHIALVVCIVAILVISENSAEAKTAAEVYKLASRSIVVIKTLDGNGKLLSSGSGVVFNNAGDVVTNLHVIERASRIIVVHNNREFTAAPKYIDRIRDVCSITVPGLNAPPVQMGKSTKVEIGSSVYAMGFPMNIGLTFSDGMISSFREAPGGRYIQFTAPISAGSSGGGLFDDEGRLIGIPTYFISQGQLLNFALPVEWVTDLPERDVAASGKHTDAQKSDADYHRQALALEEKEDWVALIQLGERWIKASPESALAWEILGYAHTENGELRQALRSYLKAVKINPDSVQDWMQLGQLYSKTAQNDNQIDAYRMVVRINPDYSGAWYKLAIIYRSKGQFENALNALQQVTRINPANESAWIQMGYVYGRLGHQAKQLSAYLEAIRVDQYSDDGYVCLGIAYGIARREAEEAEAYRQALNIHPEEISALFNLGHHYLQHGEPEKGAAIYNRLKILDPELASMFFNDLTYRVWPETVVGH